MFTTIFSKSLRLLRQPGVDPPESPARLVHRQHASHQNLAIGEIRSWMRSTSQTRSQPIDFVEINLAVNDHRPTPKRRMNVGAMPVQQLVRTVGTATPCLAEVHHEFFDIFGIMERSVDQPIGRRRKWVRSQHMGRPRTSHAIDIGVDAVVEYSDDALAEFVDSRSPRRQRRMISRSETLRSRAASDTDERGRAVVLLFPW